MATLSGTIDKQELMDRFRDYLEAEVNASIVWYDSNLPTMDTSPVSAGTTAELTILSVDLTRASSTWIDGDFAVNSATFTNGSDQIIRAAELYNKFYNEAEKMCRVRKIRIQGRVEGAGGNSGTRLTNTAAVAGRTYIELTDQTQVAYTFDSNVFGTLGKNTERVQFINSITGTPIDDQVLEDAFNVLRDWYRAARDSVYLMAAYQVCHASCHSSCHGSRGRR